MNECKISPTLSMRHRQINIRGESATLDFMGRVEVGTGKNGMTLHIERSQKKKFGGKKWHTESVYVELTPEAWAHLVSVPLEVEP